MCGIAGIFKWRGENVDREAVIRMCGAIAHRGPDSSGIEEFPEGILGHRRLSILDLSSAGHQPMTSHDGRYHVVYNGEIYNYRQLRDEHFGNTVEFRSQSDTEVLAELFAKNNLNALPELNGMFGFAIWDSESKRLYLAVDRFAIKQIYYHQTAERFVFASEVKALFEAGVPAKPHVAKLMEFHLLQRTFGQETFFHDIHSIPPGGYLILDCTTGQVESGQWYKIEDSISGDLFHDLKAASSHELRARCEEVLSQSVESRLVSDAPVGVMCSGGIDSSLTTALAWQKKKDLVAYTARIPEVGKDETEAAAVVCRHLNIKHQVFSLDEGNFFPCLPRAIYHNDSPLTHPNSIPMYGVCQLAHQDGVKVLLTGEGADEILGGYRKYSEYSRYLMLRRLTQWTPRQGRHFSSQGESTFDLWRLIGNGQLFPREQPLAMFGGIREHLDREQSLLPMLTEILGRPREAKVLAFMITDLHDYLASLLVRQDRMGMWASIESRVPFLDHRVVEFAMHAPMRQKVSIFSGKMLLRNVARKHLPKQTFRRPKLGFKSLSRGFARPEIFAGGFHETELGISIPEEARRNALIPCAAGEMWRYLNVELWGRIFCRKESPEELAERYLVASDK